MDPIDADMYIDACWKISHMMASLATAAMLPLRLRHRMADMRLLTDGDRRDVMPAQQC